MERVDCGSEKGLECASAGINQNPRKGSKLFDICSDDRLMVIGASVYEKYGKFEACLSMYVCYF